MQDKFAILGGILELISYSPKIFCDLWLCIRNIIRPIRYSLICMHFSSFISWESGSVEWERATPGIDLVAHLLLDSLSIPYMFVTHFYTFDYNMPIMAKWKNSRNSAGSFWPKIFSSLNDYSNTSCNVAWNVIDTPLPRHLYCVNSLRPRPTRRHFADDTFKFIFLNENVWIPIKISLNFVRKGPINNIPALVQIMAWCRPGDKPLSEPMMVSLPTHICVTRPQWVKKAANMLFFQHSTCCLH